MSGHRPPSATAPPRLIVMPLDEDQRTAFWSEHYLKMPYVAAGAAQAYCGMLGEGTLERLLACPQCDLTAVRNGRILPGHGPRSPAAAWALHQDGYTLVLRQVERHDGMIAGIGRHLAGALLGRLDAHIYLTPAGHSGFGWHYDAEEVFFLQTAGSKEFFLRQNTVNPLPAHDAMPRDQQFERETSPPLHCVLDAGDVLYIPSGWWHVARALTDSRSLSLGILVPTPLLLLDAVRRELAQEASWCRRLPPDGQALGSGVGELAAVLRQALADLPGQVGERLAEERFLERWVAQHRVAQKPDVQGGWVGPAG